MMGYDYLRGGMRVQVKVSQIQYNNTDKRWFFRFGYIHPGNFDDLRLVFYTPSGIYVYSYDQKINNGMTTNGKATLFNGEKSILLRGPTGVSNWKEALDQILERPIGTLQIQCNF